MSLSHPRNDASRPLARPPARPTHAFTLMHISFFNQNTLPLFRFHLPATLRPPIRWNLTLSVGASAVARGPGQSHPRLDRPLAAGLIARAFGEAPLDRVPDDWTRGVECDHSAAPVQLLRIHLDELPPGDIGAIIAPLQPHDILVVPSSYCESCVSRWSFKRARLLTTQTIGRGVEAQLVAVEHLVLRSLNKQPRGSLPMTRFIIQVHVASHIKVRRRLPPPTACDVDASLGGVVRTRRGIKTGPRSSRTVIGPSGGRPR